jgi:hypothetical protein
MSKKRGTRPTPFGSACTSSTALPPQGGLPGRQCRPSSSRRRAAPPTTATARGAGGGGGGGAASDVAAGTGSAPTTEGGGSYLSAGTLLPRQARIAALLGLLHFHFHFRLLVYRPGWASRRTGAPRAGAARLCLLRRRGRRRMRRGCGGDTGAGCESSPTASIRAACQPRTAAAGTTKSCCCCCCFPAAEAGGDGGACGAAAATFVLTLTPMTTYCRCRGAWDS